MSERTGVERSGAEGGISTLSNTKWREKFSNRQRRFNEENEDNIYEISHNL
jgi:hypothetical protein